MDIRAINSASPPATVPGGRTGAAVDASAAPPASLATTAADSNAAATLTPASLAQVNQAVESINKAVQQRGSGIEFSVDQSSKRVVVKVIDQQTREVIRQMPTEEALQIAQDLDRAQGLLIRQQG